MDRDLLQKKVLSGEVDADTLLPDLVEYIDVFYYNLFANLDTGEHSASPVSRRGNPQYALRQSFKKDSLKQLLKKAHISSEKNGSIYSHLFFLTNTIDHSVMSRDEANFFITAKGKGISRFFARLEKVIEGGYSKVTVKESTKSGYPAIHNLLYLEKPLKVYWHEKSRSYRPDPSDPYTKKVLHSLKNPKDWNSKSPMWNVGFIDIYAFTKDRMQIKGYANPLNYISKYISKSLDIDHIKEYRSCKRVSELPERYRTAAWTILNNILWNSQTWIISKAFKEDLKKIKEKIDRTKSRWIWVDTVPKDDSRLYAWMGWDVDDPQVQSSISKSPDNSPI